MYSMATRESLVGQVFHDLTVIGEAPDVGGRPASLCLCSCGQECIKKNKYLKNGDTKSCGHRYADQKQPDFYPGQVFQKLTIIEKLPRVKGKKPRYLVQCECGNTVEKYRSCVLRDESCGACKSFSYVGKKIDRLTIIKYLGLNEVGQLVYNALCDCGTERTITYNALQKNKFNSCEACHPLWSSPLEDLSGLVAGRLTVLYLWQARPNLWLSICECGKSCLHPRAELLSGNVSSCGCLKHDYMFGVLNPYVGSNSSLNTTIRRSKEYRAWRLAVYTRDNYVCQECPSPTRGTNAHHIVFLSSLLHKYNITTMEEAIACPALWDINNGITLCEDCHANKHPLLQVKKKKGRQKLTPPNQLKISIV